MNWTAKLRAWGYPEENISGLVRVLKEFNLRPEDYDTPIELARDLRPISSKARAMGWKWIIEPIRRFFHWLWERIKPWAVDIGIIGLGALITYLASGYYRAVGVIPMGVGVYRIMKRAGVVG